MDTLKCTVKDKAKAIAVVNDVLDRIDKRRFKRNTYGRGRLNLTPTECSRDVEVQQIADKIEKECETCLLGACLLSKARLYDGLKLGALSWRGDVIPEAPTNDSYVEINFDRDAVDNHLRPIFGSYEMDKLESFFEGRVMQGERLYQHITSYEVDVLRGCATEGKTHEDPRSALVAALNNFLQHDCCIVVDPVEEDDYPGEYEGDYEYEDDEDEDEDDEDEDEDEDEDLC